MTPIIDIKLPAALEKFVASQVREGRYRSREAAIIAAVLHQKHRSEQLGWVRTEIQNGSTRDQPVNSILKRQSGAGVVGSPLVLAGRAVSTASSAAGGPNSGHWRCFNGYGEAAIRGLR